MNIGHTWELEDVGKIITISYTIIQQIETINWKYLVLQYHLFIFNHIYSTSHLSCVTTPMTQVESSCTVYLKGSTPKCSTLDSSTHGERHHKSGMWTMMNTPASNWARPQWMANYWAQKLSTKVHDIIKTHLSVVHILSPLFPFSRMKLWHIASWQLHRIVSPRLLIINEGVPRGGAIRNGDFQWQYIRQTASSCDFAVGSVCLAFLGWHLLMRGMSLNPVEHHHYCRIAQVQAAMWKAKSTWYIPAFPSLGQAEPQLPHGHGRPTLPLET